MVANQLPRPTHNRTRPGHMLALAAVIVLFAGCEAQTISVLERETLFQLEIGRLEDQIDLIARQGVLPQSKTSLGMLEGFVYIGNGPANKVMEFTSYGDLIRLIYDPLQNPEPITLGDPSGSGAVGSARTRYAKEYTFGSLGRIAVDSRRHIYAEDRLPPERTVFDSTLDVQLNRIIVRFDDNGVPLDYLGQEGIGGTPFPFVDGLSVTMRDEAAVIAKTMNARLLYLFSPEGELMYTAHVGLDRLPIPEADSPMIAVLEEMIFGVDRYRVYLKISYYRTARDDETGKEAGISLDHSRVYWIELETGRYDGFFEIPRDSDDGIEHHYEMLGVTAGEYVFLVSRLESGLTRLLIMNEDGRVVRRRNLYTPEADLIMREFHLSASGVLTALLGYEDRVDVVWWRADQLLPKNVPGLAGEPDES